MTYLLIIPPKVVVNAENNEKKNPIGVSPTALKEVMAIPRISGIKEMYTRLEYLELKTNLAITTAKNGEIP
ncbi:hypothetical protein AYI68_g509 [Smittium mucronatum]|uniref:Uncharacterized protein n=1 Tax=Smittium mucronatum TaxID=133383 RepID=A0A1R0H7W7_9FUNG|nr:hypothetical protein AYI68_g509 [Smittium mucronatum]